MLRKSGGKAKSHKQTKKKQGLHLPPKALELDLKRYLGTNTTD